MDPLWLAGYSWTQWFCDPMSFSGHTSRMALAA